MEFYVISAKSPTDAKGVIESRKLGTQYIKHSELYSGLPFDYTDNPLEAMTFPTADTAYEKVESILNTPATTLKYASGETQITRPIGSYMIFGQSSQDNIFKIVKITVNLETIENVKESSSSNTYWNEITK